MRIFCAIIKTSPTVKESITTSIGSGETSEVHFPAADSVKILRLLAISIQISEDCRSNSLDQAEVFVKKIRELNTAEQLIASIALELKFEVGTSGIIHNKYRKKFFQLHRSGSTCLWDPLDIGVSTKGLECCWMGGISGDGI
ncbi:unnamed protein product, partial [Allacma fusca]